MGYEVYKKQCPSINVNHQNGKYWAHVNVSCHGEICLYMFRSVILHLSQNKLNLKMAKLRHFNMTINTICINKCFHFWRRANPYESCNFFNHSKTGSAYYIQCIKVSCWYSLRFVLMMTMMLSVEGKDGFWLHGTCLLLKVNPTQGSESLSFLTQTKNYRPVRLHLCRTISKRLATAFVIWTSDSQHSGAQMMKGH